MSFDQVEYISEISCEKTTGRFEHEEIYNCDISGHSSDGRMSWTEEGITRIRGSLLYFDNDLSPRSGVNRLGTNLQIKGDDLKCRREGNTLRCESEYHL